jgi:hypothetical protein
MLHDDPGHTSNPLLFLCCNEGEVAIDRQCHKEEDGVGGDEGFECHAMTHFLQVQEHRHCRRLLFSSLCPSPTLSSSSIREEGEDNKDDNNSQ